MSKIRVLVVEDSLVVRECLVHFINHDPRLEVAAAVSTAEEALRCIKDVNPDVVSLDIRLPGMDGFEATLRIMAEHPTPIVVISANVTSEELNISMNALRAGALAVLEKPEGAGLKDYEAKSRTICDQLVIMSAVKVVRQRVGRNLSFTSDSQVHSIFQSEKARLPLGYRSDYGVLGVVASTGGPSALATLLAALPSSEFKLPICLVQHITNSFLGSFAQWLASISTYQVVITEGGALLKPGTIYLAPVDHHLEVHNGRTRLTTQPPISLQRPSGTLLFSSIAKEYGPKGIGVLLTGMGDDGATGLLDLKNSGGYTIAEDASTAVVFGMPAVAARLGAVRDLLPLQGIAPKLMSLVSASNEGIYAT